MDYNLLFQDLKEYCEINNCCCLFNNISLDELIDLNYLLDRFLVFCENVDLNELEEYECGDQVIKLHKLVDSLFARDL